MVVSCEQCRRSYRFDETGRAGTTVSLRCRACGAEIRVSVPAPGDDDAPRGDEREAAPAVPAKGSLAPDAAAALKGAHGAAPTPELADSIKAVLLLDAGVSVAQAARILLRDNSFVEKAWEALARGGVESFTARAWTAEEGDRPAFDLLRLELGYGLLPLADPTKGGDLLERLKVTREDFFARRGFAFGAVRVQDNMLLERDEYRIVIGGVQAASGNLVPEKLLAVKGDPAADPLEGEHIREPVFGVEALWIEADQAGDAGARGYSVISPASVVTTHLGEVLAARAHELLTLSDAAGTVQVLRDDDPDAARALESAKGYSLSLVLDLLRELAFEGVSLADRGAVAEGLARGFARYHDPGEILSIVRARLGRVIVGARADQGVLRVTMPRDSIVDAVAAETARVPPVGEFSFRPPGEIVDEIRSSQWPSKTVLVDTALRRAMARVMMAAFPAGDFIVISREEAPHGMEIENVSPFYFEDIPLLGAPAVAHVVRRAGLDLMARALKGASKSLCEAVFDAAEESEALREAMEFMGPVPLADVERAQGEIEALIARMDEEGRDVLDRASGGEELVI